MTETIETSVLKVLAGRCPRCGQGRLFKGYLRLNSNCSYCDLDFEFAESGDGPAFFIMILVGFLVVLAAILTEIHYRPPYWVHAALWLPAILMLSALLLRPLKSLMIWQQYKHQAREGRLSK